MLLMQIDHGCPKPGHNMIEKECRNRMEPAIARRSSLITEALFCREKSAVQKKLGFLGDTPEAERLAKAFTGAKLFNLKNTSATWRRVTVKHSRSSALSLHMTPIR